MPDTVLGLSDRTSTKTLEELPLAWEDKLTDNQKRGKPV
jgi:hypothetical protein